MVEGYCEALNCTMPGTLCPACDQYFCWQHMKTSSCEVCNKLITHNSFEYRMRRLVGIGLSVILCGFLFLLLPRDENGVILQLAILFLVSGSLLIWLGLLAGLG